LIHSKVRENWNEEGSAKAALFGYKPKANIGFSISS
jgi:hypothetical protein